MIIEITEGNTIDTSIAIANNLNLGGVSIVPTDTVYGIVADAFNREAVKRIYDIKGRDENKPFLILIKSIDDVKYFSDMVLPQKIRKYIPGMLTFILPLKDSLQDKLSYLHGSVAIRVVADSFISSIIEYTNSQAVVAPSANPAGVATLSDRDEIISMYENIVDIIAIDNKDKSNALASTIYDCIDDKVIRMGSVVLDF